MAETAEVKPTEVSPRKLTRSTPEYNAVERLNGILYRLGKLTTQSRLPFKSTDSDRPIALRNTRAELLKLALESDDAKRREIFAEAHARDEIALQYLSQGEITVNLPGLGKQTARYTLIEPPESRKSVETKDKPPIFLIPGISGDIDTVGVFVQEVPFMGRNVVVVAFPESYMGRITKEFAKAVQDAQDHTPHVAFFKNAINELIGKDSEFELWGFSTGSPIAAQIIADPEFQSRVSDAVFISSASALDQSGKQLNIGSISEIKKVVRRLSSLGRYTFTRGRGKEFRPDGPNQKRLKKQAFEGLLERVKVRFPGWDKAKVKEGGTIVVVSGRKDTVTKSARAEAEFAKNPQVKILNLPNDSHLSPLMEPARVLPQIFQMRARPLSPPPLAA